jgi:hypothetical protein
VRWASFACASLLTWIAYTTLWATEWYQAWLSLLCVLNVCLATWVLRRTGVNLLSMTGVIAGLLLGQWWLVQFVILQFFWRAGGFAP